MPSTRQSSIHHPVRNITQSLIISLRWHHTTQSKSLWSGHITLSTSYLPPRGTSPSRGHVTQNTSRSHHSPSLPVDPPLTSLRSEWAGHLADKGRRKRRETRKTERGRKAESKKKVKEGIKKAQNWEGKRWRGLKLEREDLRGNRRKILQFNELLRRKNEGRDSEWRKDYEEEEDEESVVRNQWDESMKRK